MLDTIDTATKLRYAGKAIGLGGQTAANAMRAPLRAMHLGGRTAARKPDWTARGIRWSMAGTPLWPWEQKRVERRLGGVLPERWPWEARREPEQWLTVRLAPLMAGMALGALVMYLFDPRMGHYRRLRLLATVGIKRPVPEYDQEMDMERQRVDAEAGMPRPMRSY